MCQCVNLQLPPEAFRGMHPTWDDILWTMGGGRNSTLSLDSVSGAHFPASVFVRVCARACCVRTRARVHVCMCVCVRACVTEPAFTAVFSGLITGKWDHPYVYLTLVPIMGGVAYASASELNFNMLQFVAAMVCVCVFVKNGK